VIVEERTYTLYHGKVPEYLGLYESEGLAIQRPILGHLVGYFTTEIGTLNQVVHMWAYSSMEDRTRRRAQLTSNPDWQAYIAKTRPLIQVQENRILIPTRFSPLNDATLKQDG